MNDGLFQYGSHQNYLFSKCDFVERIYPGQVAELKKQYNYQLLDALMLYVAFFTRGIFDLVNTLGAI